MSNSEGSLLSQALLNRSFKKGFIINKAVERPGILLQTFLSLTTPSSSDPCLQVWKAKVPGASKQKPSPQSPCPSIPMNADRLSSFCLSNLQMLLP